MAIGPSIKCVRSRRKGGSQDKSIQLLFYDVILLFKSGQGVAAYVLYEWFPWSLSVATFTKRQSKSRTSKHMSVAEWTNTFSIHHWMCFSIESWTEWKSKPRPLNLVQMNCPTELPDHEFDLYLQPIIYRKFSFTFV